MFEIFGSMSRVGVKHKVNETARTRVLAVIYF